MRARKPSNRPTRRAAAVIAAAGWGALMATTACGPPDPYLPPTIPTVDTRPSVVVEVDERGLRAVGGEKLDPAVTIDPFVVPQGTVIAVANRGRSAHRLHVEGLFDTGLLQPGDITTIVLTKETPTETTYEVADTVATDVAPGRLRLVVRPRPLPAS